MLFKYKAITKEGGEKEGIIDALNIDVATTSLQGRGLIVSRIELRDKPTFFRKIPFFNRVKTKEIVIVSRQMATLFESQVSALRVFRLLSSETDNMTLKMSLGDIADSLQEGSSISEALAKHPHIFSNFYISMVKVGEESGKLGQVFVFLADYLDRTYALTSKAKHALVYPIFVIAAFIGVMVLLLTVIIPKITPILLESGAELPVYTKIVIGMSGFLLTYGIFILVGFIILGFFVLRYMKTERGSITLSNIKLSLPYIGGLYRKLYLTRIADNMNTMIGSGISMLQALDSTSSVVDNDVFKAILEQSAEEVKGGKALSAAFAKYEDIPSIVTQMIRVGEETGELGSILGTLAKFYQREVVTSVDTLVDLIQPVIILVLGLSVGFLLAAVLMPIYNIAGAF
ncbi:MAG: type II secretion system F family protein [Patescibacteria group bacterium]